MPAIPPVLVARIFAATSTLYRLIKEGGARRVVFLVYRGHLSARRDGSR